MILNRETTDEYIVVTGINVSSYDVSYVLLIEVNFAVKNHSVSSLHILPRNERTSLESASPVLEMSSFKEMTEESEQQGVGGPTPKCPL